MILNYCIGCGCDEAHACATDAARGLCWWMRFSARHRAGVCSYCEDQLEHWDGGGRTPRLELVADRFHRQALFLYEHEAAAKAWVNTPHQLLDGRSPRQLILAGEIERVYAILDQLRDGAFA